jgi:hypothetical protein
MEKRLEDMTGPKLGGVSGFLGHRKVGSTRSQLGGGAFTVLLRDFETQGLRPIQRALHRKGWLPIRLLSSNGVE